MNMNMIAKDSKHRFDDYNSRSPLNPWEKQGLYPIMLLIVALIMV
jgi:hypothetical protein